MTSETTVVRKSYQRSDFQFGPVLGEGSFSTVTLATDKRSGKEYAMKILEKSHIIRERKVPQVEREKRVLTRLCNHHFFVKFFFTFQDTERLYFGLSVARRGELHSKIRLLGKFDLQCTRFYSAQMVSALEYMHSLNIIHRDLKPENILFNDDMNIQITDFGTAKDLNEAGKEVDIWTPRTSTFVGTAQFISPELLTDKKACALSDIWAFACIVYQMITGNFAFNAATEYLTLLKIQSCDFDIPPEIDSSVADLIKEILVLEPSLRLGSQVRGGYQSLKNHPFFDSTDWDAVDTTPVPDSIKEVLVSDSSDDEESVDPFSESIANVVAGLDTISFSPDHQVSGPETNGNTSKDLTLSEPTDVTGYGLPLLLTSSERNHWMSKQQKSVWNYYAEGKLILKQGQLEKKRGFSTKSREFLLLEGPRLLYIDPVSKETKGEIPWSRKLTTELKNFRLFDIHTPNRTYHLVDRTNNAMRWCRKIEHVKRHYYDALGGE